MKLEYKIALYNTFLVFALKSYLDYQKKYFLMKETKWDKCKV